MNFRSTGIQGVFLIEPDRLADDRGYFARTWCRREFEQRGLNPALAQCSASYNRSKGTIRGMHYQAEPHAEAKLVRVTRGAAYDVALDLRPASPTFGQWFAATLSAGSGTALYVAEGLAHGFQTLEDDTEVLYQISVEHHPEAARGVRWNDPAFGIRWPIADARLSEKDRSLPDFAATQSGHLPPSR